MLSFSCNVIIKIVYNLLQIFGLLLPAEFADLSLYNNKFWILKRIYAVFISVLLLCSYTYLEWLSSQTIYKDIRTSSIILLILSHTSLTVICLLSVLGNVFWHKEKWEHSLKLNKILSSKMKVKLQRHILYFCLEFILGNIALFVVIGVNLWRNNIFNNGELVLIIFMVLKEGLLYYAFLITIIIYNSVLLLRNNFRSIRIILISTVGLEEKLNEFTLYRPLEGAVIFPNPAVGEKTLSGLIEGSKILNILFECIDIFNKQFGLIIMLINMCTILSILSALNSLLVSVETNDLNTEIILDSIFEALMFLIWNSFILSASGLLKEESSEFVKLCCKLQHLMPQTSQERKELLNLAHQVRRKSPRISASGFFDVDFFLILAVFTYVGTYIVVLIQFSRMNF